MLAGKLHLIKTKPLRRLARYLRVKRWSRLRRAQLIEEVAWKLDPWKDRGMH